MNSPKNNGNEGSVVVHHPPVGVKDRWQTPHEDDTDLRPRARKRYWVDTFTIEGHYRNCPTRSHGRSEAELDLAAENAALKQENDELKREIARLKRRTARS